MGSIPGPGRYSVDGNDSPLQCSHLGNPTDCRPPGSSVHGISQTQTPLSMQALEKLKSEGKRSNLNVH